MEAGGAEILTVQAGSCANEIGAHLWNNQAAVFTFDPDAPKPDIRHDCLFRAGKTVHGRETYLPRAVIYDLKGNHGQCIQDFGEVEADRKNVGTWEGAVDRVELPSEESTPGSLSKSWPDLLKVPLHWNSLAILKQYSHSDDPPRFDTYMSGTEAFRGRGVADEFEDKTHMFLEECDQPQGIQVLLDMHDGFGGFGSSLVTMLRDDHGKIPIFSFGFVPQYDLKDSKRNIVNEAHTFIDLVQTATVVVPIATTGWDGQVLNQGSTDKLASQQQIACALETASLGYRLKDDGHVMGQVAAMLLGSCRCFRNVVALGSSFPLLEPSWDQKSPLSTVVSSLGTTPINDTEHLTYYCPAYAPKPSSQSDPVSSMYCVLRGVERNSLRPSLEQMQSIGSPSEFDRCSSAKDMFSRYMGKSNSSEQFFVAESQQKVPILDSGKNLSGLAVLAGDHQIKSSVEDLQKRFAATPRVVKQRFEDRGFSGDDFEELDEALSALLV